MLLVSYNVNVNGGKAIEVENMSMFMDDTTLSEVLDISNHLTGRSIGNTQRNVDSVVKFAIEERMELNGNKCKEMLIDLRKKRTEIPLIKNEAHSMSWVKYYKLLRLWLGDDLKWNTNTEYITNKASKRLYLLKILKKYGAPQQDLLTFYSTVIR